MHLDLAAIFNGFLLMGLLGLGIGTLNCVLFGFWPTWRNIWNVLTKPLFIMSGMFFTFEAMPRQLQDDPLVQPAPPLHRLRARGLLRRLRSRPTSRRSTFSASPGTTFLVGAYLLRRHASALIEQ